MVLSTIFLPILPKGTFVPRREFIFCESFHPCPLVQSSCLSFGLHLLNSLREGRVRTDRKLIVFEYHFSVGMVSKVWKFYTSWYREVSGLLVVDPTFLGGSTSFTPRPKLLFLLSGYWFFGVPLNRDVFSLLRVVRV